MKYLALMMVVALVGCGKNNGRTPSLENPTALDSVSDSGGSETLESPVETPANPDDSPTEFPDGEEESEVEAPKSPTLPIATNMEFESESCFLGKWRADDRLSYLHAEVKFLTSGIAHFQLEKFADRDCKKRSAKQNIHVRFEIVKTDSDVVVIRMEEFGNTTGISWLTLRSGENSLNINWNAEWKFAGPHEENPAAELIQEYANCSDSCGIAFLASK